MNLDKFRRQFHTKVLSRAKELQPLTTIWGTNSPLIQATLNLAVSCMEEGEAYFEVGCLFGSSLAAASAGNDDKIKYCLDMQWQGSMPQLITSIPNLYSKESKYEDVDLDSFLKHPVGIFFFDGSHERKNTFEALEGIIPYLADNALVILDDLNYARVLNAWRDWTRKNYMNVTIMNEFWTEDRFIGLTRGERNGWHDSIGWASYERFPHDDDEAIEEVTIGTWHSTPPYEGHHNFVFPPQFKHIHGKEFMHISQWEKEQEGGFVIKRDDV